MTFRLKMPLNNKEPILLLYRLLSHTFHFSSAEHKSSKSLLLPEPQKQLTCPAKKHTHTLRVTKTHTDNRKLNELQSTQAQKNPKHQASVTMCLTTSTETRAALIELLNL